MLNLDALFKIPYGLYLAGAELGGRRGGCIINTAAQVTAEPPRMLVTLQKSTYTAELIRQKGSLCVSVLSRACPLDVVKRFGYESGREKDKFSGIGWRPDRHGNPYLAKHTCAVYALSVEETVDVGTHWLFLCAVEDAETTSADAPLTYDDYRTLKAGGTLGQADAPPRERRFVCTVCHYVYDGDIPFDDLPADWVCPVCHVGKDKFILD